MHNPNIKYAKSNGIDLPIMYVYLAGRICGEHIEKCLAWRNKIVNHYKKYKSIRNYETNNIIGYESYPISFLDALNSKEADSIDKKGLTSFIPPNLIYDKDLLSVEKADVIVANMNDMMEEGIEDILLKEGEAFAEGFDYQKAFYRLHDSIVNRRPNWGTDSEVAWALYLKKPLILIADLENFYEMLQYHPFMKRASVIVKDVDELLEKKWLNILYKSISGAIYE